MKTNLIILIAIAGITYGLTLFYGTQKPPAKPVPTGEQLQKTNQPVPDFNFTTLSGKTYSIKDFEGKNIILNFWASWCAPCIKEFPVLLRAANESTENTVLIALSSDLDENAITTFINKMKNTQNMDFSGNNILIAHDKNQAITGNMFQTFKLPETILIDKTQTMRHKFIGANWTYDDLQKRLSGLN